MLSFNIIFNFLLGLVLSAVVAWGSEELRIAVGTVSSWALGHLLLRRFAALPAGFRRAFHAYLFVSFWLLAAYNDIFWENVFGRVLDLWFPRRGPNDCPGGGFTYWVYIFRRRHAYEIAFACRFLHFAVRSVLAAVFVVLAVPLVHWQVKVHREQARLERAIAYLHEYGELPPWDRVQPPVEMPPPKRDTIYMRLSDDIVIVCGPGGGFATVVAGVLEDSPPSRMPGHYKVFS